MPSAVPAYRVEPGAVGLQPVSRIDDRDLGIGPITRKARELYWAFARAAG